MSKVIIVTGSARGIGYATVRTLAKHFPNDNVYLTDLNVEMGEKAVKDLAAENILAKFHELDITKQSSVDTFASFIKVKYGGVDVFVHNAGIVFEAGSTATFAEKAEVTIRVNYTGSLNVWNAFSPLLRSGARWVNVVSRTGMLSLVKEAKVRETLSSPTATFADITSVMERFVKEAKEGKNEMIGKTGSYGMSKAGLTALTRIQQRLVDDKSDDIVVNCQCPGWVKSDMSTDRNTGTNTVKTLEQAGEISVYCAELPANTPIRGKLLVKENNWEKPEECNWENPDFKVEEIGL